MRKLLLSAVLVGVVLASGCGIYMNPKYTETFDKTVELSDVSLLRIKTGEFPTPEARADFAVAVLEKHNKVLHAIQDARNGDADPDVVDELKAGGN